MAASKHLQIDVFVPKTVQLLNLSPIDLFGILSPDYIRVRQLPEPLVALGVPSTIHYISIPENGTHVELTASASLEVIKAIEDPNVQAGKLDIILVPGPEPSAIFDDPALEFLQEHAAWKGSDGEVVDILSVCTGAILLGQSGTLKGKRACGPRALLRKQFPDVNWVDDKRWIHDGNIWTRGGITNGQEMVASYMREKFSGPATEAFIAMTDVGTKGSTYTNSKASETLWWLWQILKAVMLVFSK